MGIFSATKDRLVEQTARAYLNRTWLAPYGRATSVRLDSDAKTVRVDLELKGEPSTVWIEFVGYEITRQGERYFAAAREIRTSREWLTQLARNRFGQTRVELPVEAGRILTLAL